MKIGIIGAGNIGGALTRRLTAVGHPVVVANSRGPASLAALVAETGATAVSPEEAARNAEAVVVTIPKGKIPQLPADLFRGVPDSVVVVDTGNYYPQRDGKIDAIEGGATESRWVSRRRRPWCCGFSTSSASTAWTPAASTSRGGSSPGAPSTDSTPTSRG